jgi:hypothetical protein
MLLLTYCEELFARMLVRVIFVSDGATAPSAPVDIVATINNQSDATKKVYGARSGQYNEVICRSTCSLPTILYVRSQDAALHEGLSFDSA